MTNSDNAVLGCLVTAVVVTALIIAVTMQPHSGPLGSDPPASEESRMPPSLPVPVDNVWQTVQRVPGEGTRKTQQFTIRSREWRIAWNAHNRDR